MYIWEITFEQLMNIINCHLSIQSFLVSRFLVEFVLHRRSISITFFSQHSSLLYWHCSTKWVKFSSLFSISEFVELYISEVRIIIIEIILGEGVQRVGLRVSSGLIAWRIDSSRAEARPKNFIHNCYADANIIFNCSLKVERKQID